jgi:hypothetical protein
MKSISKNYFLFLLTNFYLISYSYAQISISNISEIDKIIQGKTYILMKDPESEIAKEYIKVFWDYWTISKIEFIKYSDFEKYLNPNDSYFMIGGYVTNTSFATLFTKEQSNKHIDNTITHLYLQLFTCNKKYFQAKDKNIAKEFTDDERVEVARVELYTDNSTLANPDNIYQSDYNVNGHIYNWGPGILKNQIQTLMNLLMKNEIRNLFDGNDDQIALLNLQNETLYIPDYFMNKFNKLTGEESQKFDENEIFEDFKLKYKIISIEELNKKILSEKKPFYYLVYIRSQIDKYICVYNSFTGDMIYSKYYPVSYNIKSGDLKDLQKRVQSN